MTAEFSYKNFEAAFADGMRELEQAVREREYLKAIQYLRFLAMGYYQTNDRLADDQMEEITEQISRDILGETTVTGSNPKTVVFYDGFGHIDFVLGKIYIDALDQLGYQTTWVIHINAPSLEAIRKYCEVKNSVTLRIIPKSPILERMRHLQDLIRELAPRHLFFHGTPWDICGLSVFSTVTGDTTRYLIDLTDHAFWLGKCAADCFIAFRNVGYQVETQLRGIAPEKIMILPYYPNQRKQYPYAGLPFDEAQHKFIFSGGNPYKLEGDDTYREMVEYILSHYPEIKFVYAGVATRQEQPHPLLAYLENKYPGQFFHVDVRQDLDEVLQRAKLYLGTYPVLGGLMTQYAVQNRCIPLCLSSKEGPIMDPKTLVLRPEDVQFVFHRKEDLLAELDRLLTDEQHYREMRDSLVGQVITPEEFAEELGQVMTEHRTKFRKTDESVDLTDFLEIYKKRANRAMFCKIIRESRNEYIQQKYSEIMSEDV